MNLSFVSNTCVGWRLFENFDIKPYNNPFISTLIPDDNQFVKLINNLNYYVDILPVIGNPKINYYNHPDIRIPYPVIFLEDIEIHCIHENDNTECLDKFLRRIERFKDFLKDDNNKTFVVLSFSEMFMNHEFTESVIADFLKPISKYIIKIFLGPSKWYNEENKHYIIVNKWDDLEITRNENNLITWSNQDLVSNTIINYIISNPSLS
jgi:hypothetical protein